MLRENLLDDLPVKGFENDFSKLFHDAYDLGSNAVSAVNGTVADNPVVSGVAALAVATGLLCLSRGRLAPRPGVLPATEAFTSQVRAGTVSVLRKDGAWAGSGFATGKDTIATASHVLKDDPRNPVQILTQSGQSLLGKVIANDPIADAAILRTLEPHNLPVLPLAESSIGRKAHVTAYGVVRGEFHERTGKVLGNSDLVTMALSRSRKSRRLDTRLRLSSDTVPGMSGGPVVDKLGRVVGLNTDTYIGPLSSVIRRSFASPVESLKALHARLQ